MPVNGLIFACDKWELSLSGAFSYVTPNPPLSAVIGTAWAPDMASLSDGLRIEWSKGKIVLYWLGAQMVNGTGTAGSLALLDLRVYAMPAMQQWRVQWSGIEGRIGGSLVATQGAGAMTSPYIAPSGIPVIGVPPTLSLVAGAIQTDTRDNFSCWASPFDVTDTNTATVTGGWRFFRDGAWHALPAQVPTLPAPSGSIPMPSVGGSSCAAMTLSVTGTAHSTFDGAVAHVDSLVQSARVQLVPAVETGIHRMNPSFAAMIKRYAIPGTRARATYDANGVVSTVESDITPVRSSFLETIRDGEGVIEDALIPAYCPVYLDAHEDHVTASCPNSEATVSWSGTREHGNTVYPELVGASPTAGYLNHASDVGTFVNYVVHPLWSFALQREDWPIDGAPVPKEDYWDRVAEQWLFSPFLPASQATKTRTTLLSEPLATSAWAPFLDSFFAGERWIGISRFRVAPAVVPGEVIAGETGWSFSSCTGTWSGGVLTVTPSASSFEVEYDLGQWGQPWQFPHIAREIWTGWSGAGSVYLVGEDGSEVLLTDVSGQWVVRPIGEATKFAGSWAVNVLGDVGVDTGTAGISASVVTDAEKSCAFGLLVGRGARKLRFEFTGSSPVTLQKPKFRTSEANLLPESRVSQIGLWELGPGVRVGQWNFAGTPATPAVRVPGTTPTALDALCTRRVVFEGRDREDGLRSEILGLWDAFELGLAASPSDATVFASAVPGTLSFWHGSVPESVLVNTAAEVPPLAMFPQFRRGGWTAEVDMYAVEPRYCVAPAGTSLSQLVPPSGAPDWLLSGDSPAGWQVRHHTHAVNGDESDFRVKRGGQEFAHAVRPWRSFLWMGAAPNSGEGLDHFVSPLGDEHRVFVRDGEVRYQGSTYATPGAMDIDSVVAEGVSPRVFEDQFRRVWVSYLSSGDVYTCFSDDHGRTWSEPTMLISNAKFPRHFPGFDGSALWAVFRYVSGTSGPGHLIGRYQSAGDATPSSEFVLASASGALVVADDTFSVALGVDGAQQWSLFCRFGRRQRPERVRERGFRPDLDSGLGQTASG